MSTLAESRNTLVERMRQSVRQSNVKQRQHVARLYSWRGWKA
jgi:hypothetical protein